MENLNIEATRNTPKINLNANNGILEIKGCSIPSNSAEFYANVFKWAIEYCKKPNVRTVINFQIDYINTSSSKFILNFLHVFEDLYKSGYEVIIHWYYDDVDSCETGEDVKSLIEVPFELISI